MPLRNVNHDVSFYVVIVRSSLSTFGFLSLLGRDCTFSYVQENFCVLNFKEVRNSQHASQSS